MYIQQGNISDKELEGIFQNQQSSAFFKLFYEEAAIECHRRRRYEEAVNYYYKSTQIINIDNTHKIGYTLEMLSQSFAASIQEGSIGAELDQRKLNNLFKQDPLWLNLICCSYIGGILLMNNLYEKSLPFYIQYFENINEIPGTLENCIDRNYFQIALQYTRKAFDKEQLKELFGNSKICNSLCYGYIAKLYLNSSNQEKYEEYITEFYIHYKQENGPMQGKIFDKVMEFFVRGCTVGEGKYAKSLLDVFKNDESWLGYANFNIANYYGKKNKQSIAINYLQQNFQLWKGDLEQNGNEIILKTLDILAKIIYYDKLNNDAINFKEIFGTEYEKLKALFKWRLGLLMFDQFQADMALIELQNSLQLLQSIYSDEKSNQFVKKVKISIIQAKFKIGNQNNLDDEAKNVFSACEVGEFCEILQGQIMKHSCVKGVLYVYQCLKNILIDKNEKEEQAKLQKIIDKFKQVREIQDEDPRNYKPFSLFV